jgi:palmitoyltransferase
MFRVERKPLVGDGFTKSWDVDEFKRRQAVDRARYTDADNEYIVRRRPFHERLEQIAHQRDYSYEGAVVESDEESDTEEKKIKARQKPSEEGEEAWRNREGERLADFGVDEAAEFYDEDDLPLAELIRRRGRVVED